MKKHLMTGLSVLLPIALTLFIVIFLFNLLTRPFQGTIANLLSHYNLLDTPFWFLTGEQVLIVSSKILAFISLLALIFLIGFLGHLFLVNYLLKIGDAVFYKIPFVSKLYRAIQEVTKTLLSTTGAAFTHVVLAPFPNEKAYSIGLVTKLEMPSGSDPQHQGMIAVFIPGTPNPTFGFMEMYRKEQLIFLTMKVDDALKCIVSGGVMSPPFAKSGE